METVQQHFKSDCAVACLAMFLGEKYEAIAKHCHGFELVSFGLSAERTDDIADLFGADLIWRDPSKLDRSRPAVLSVPSLNLDGSRHSVFWDGQALHDPNEFRPGKRCYTAAAAWQQAIDGYQRDEQ
jgi:hypothetical protein